MKSPVTVFIVACTALLLWSPVARAQEFGRVDQITASGVPYHTFIQVGEPSVQVLVLGSASSGVYEVGVTTDLIKFIALIGVPANGDGRNVNVTLLRDEGTVRREVYKESLDDILRESASTPQLQEGDVLMIDAPQPRPRMSLIQGLQIATSLTSVALLLLRSGF